MGQHFSAIAAAGPIVGPILAGVAFGWLPALIWILCGSILIGGVHDFASLVASVRHKARSIAEVVREHMSSRSYILFLAFVWIALIYIIVAFTDITASSFLGRQTLENGETVSGGGIATSSLLYLVLPILMGLCMQFLKMPLWLVTVIFVPLVGVAIWVGQFIPFDLGQMLGVSDIESQKIWGGFLLLYCLVAAMVPMWLLLQPRGHLGGCFLYVALAGAAIGLVASDTLLGGDMSIQYPAFMGWQTQKAGPLVPMLFITIACGACSGFHSLIASGTTSKQLRKETDAKVIGYGTMLLEAFVAVVSLSCVMVLTKDSPLSSQPPNFVYALGMGRFLEILGVPASIGVSFAAHGVYNICLRYARCLHETRSVYRAGTHRTVGNSRCMARYGDDSRRSTSVPSSYRTRCSRQADSCLENILESLWCEQSTPCCTDAIGDYCLAMALDDRRGYGSSQVCRPSSCL